MTQLEQDELARLRKWYDEYIGLLLALNVKRDEGDEQARATLETIAGMGKLREEMIIASMLASWSQQPLRSR
jgi:hypothetical protein